MWMFVLSISNKPSELSLKGFFLTLFSKDGSVYCVMCWMDCQLLSQNQNCAEMERVSHEYCWSWLTSSSPNQIRFCSQVFSTHIVNVFSTQGHSSLRKALYGNFWNLSFTFNCFPFFLTLCIYGTINNFWERDICHKPLMHWAFTACICFHNQSFMNSPLTPPSSVPNLGKVSQKNEHVCQQALDHWMMSLHSRQLNEEGWKNICFSPGLIHWHNCGPVIGSQGLWNVLQ